MSVKIRIPYLQNLGSRQKVFDTNGSTVGECLSALVKQFPQLEGKLFDTNGKLLKNIDVYINGESAYPDELAKEVNNGDEIHISNILAGG